MRYTAGRIKEMKANRNIRDVIGTLIKVIQPHGSLEDLVQSLEWLKRDSSYKALEQEQMSQQWDALVSVLMRDHEEMVAAGVSERVGKLMRNE